MEAIDRRTLMRRAGVVGAVAWSAPLILDSLASPAAAMSGQTVTVASLGAFTDASSDAATISAGPFASSTVGHSVLVLLSTRQQTLTPTLSIGAGGPIASPVLLATVTYVVGATRTWTLWAYLATGTGAAGNFDVMCNSSRNLAVSVLQVDGEDTGAPIATSVIANGNPGAPNGVTFPAPDPLNAQVVLVGCRTGTTWTAPPGFTELDDVASGIELSMETSAATAPITGAATATPLAATARWGAIGIELTNAP
jgi:hypothetical protein